jgi:ergothioneine biosynthesis protein EgtB
MRDSNEDISHLVDRYEQTRRQSEDFCEPLTIEDYGLQAMPETSPPKWHLAHTTWFFETFILKPYQRGFEPWHLQFEQLFNSYYNGVGEQFPRPKRGLLSRPSVEEVLAYRQAVDHQIRALLQDEQHSDRETIRARVELGINHEQQHQELFFTDVKYSLSINPLNPVFSQEPLTPSDGAAVTPITWHEFEGGLCEVGHRGDGFCYDNETPRHRTFIEPFALAHRLATNAEYLAFIDDGGYRRPELWLADGWSTVQQHGWSTPLYWRQKGNTWYEYTLHGLQPLDLARPVCHLSAYEADAFARWSQARLPTEFEWEYAARDLPVEGQFVESRLYHPEPAAGAELQQLFGSAWEWTSSAYSPYPNFRPPAGTIGEYNGKFMCNQLVLRGGSCVSPRSHLRATYRNFFYPPDRWQFSGVRLAKSLS